MTGWYAWFWYAGGGTLAVGGLAAMVVFLFADRSRGRRRCPKCWYDMSSVAGLLCPECGRAARSERRLFKTRRRFGRASLACLLVLLGASAAAAPVIRKHGSWRLAPTRAMVYALPWVQLHSPKWQRDFQQELFSRTLSASEYNLLIRKAAALYRSGSFRGPIAAKTQVWFQLDAYRLDSQQRIVPGVGRGFVWHVHDLEPLPYSVLKPQAVEEFAEALAQWWVAGSSNMGRPAARELWVLASQNRHAMDVCLSRIFSEPVAWTIYRVDPRSGGGEAMRVLVKELKSDDPERRARAAACLADAYFDVNVHWRNPDPALRWIKDQYMDYEQLCTLAAPAGDRLVERALAGDTDEADQAARALCEMGVTFREQALRLHQHADSLRPFARQEVERLNGMFSRYRDEK